MPGWSAAPTWMGMPQEMNSQAPWSSRCSASSPPGYWPSPPPGHLYGCQRPWWSHRIRWRARPMSSSRNGLKAPVASCRCRPRLKPWKIGMAARATTVISPSTGAMDPWMLPWLASGCWLAILISLSGGTCCGESWWINTHGREIRGSAC